MSCFTATISPCVTIAPTIKPVIALAATVKPNEPLTAVVKPCVNITAQVSPQYILTASVKPVLTLSAYTSDFCPCYQIGADTILWDDGTELWLDEGKPVDYRKHITGSCFTATISPCVTIAPTIKPVTALAATVKPNESLTAVVKPCVDITAQVSPQYILTVSVKPVLTLSAYTSDFCPCHQIGADTLLWDDGTELWLDDGKPVDYRKHINP